MMDMSMGMNLLPQQQMKASPALIALNNMLVLSTQDLQQLVQAELAENPALDQVESEESLCSRCGRPLSGATCIYCLHEDLKLAEAERDDASTPAADDEFDPLLAVAAPTSLHEAVRRDLHVSLPERDHAIVDYLVGSLDDHGFLDGSVEEIAAMMQVEPARVEHVLLRLQEFGPAGLGARDVQECLLIQLARLERQGMSNPHLREIVADYWFDLGEHRYGAIAQALGITYDDVVAARDFMRQHLRPFPLERASESANTIDTSYLMPDVIIREESGQLVAEVVESRRFYLRLNPLYQELAQAMARGQQDISPDEREHLSTFVSRARLFLTNLRQRRETIRRIAEYLIERQEAYLRHGVRHLAPLTRAEVAAAIGVHESTVSRATANKYVQIPNKEIVPFSHFFTASLSVKDVINELITNESTPLTDQDIVEILKGRGFDVARRTVTKYRGQLGILPSTLR
ncbi:MAG TPA: RNA polymerase factor sigma-54 [Roseiflexaceae bacterium]|nr:RNA polymerase factor sigma-54 [Roseiflexaceae bacterium]